eukprot:782048-Rhodomonas_salina.5
MPLKLGVQGAEPSWADESVSGWSVTWGFWCRGHLGVDCCAVWDDGGGAGGAQLQHHHTHQQPVPAPPWGPHLPGPQLRHSQGWTSPLSWQADVELGVIASRCKQRAVLTPRWDGEQDRMGNPVCSPSDPRVQAAGGTI